MKKYLNINLSYSVIYLLIWVMIYIVSCISIFLLPFDIKMRVIFMIGIGLIMLQQIRPFLPNYKKRIRLLQVSYRGKMAILTQAGCWLRVEARDAHFCSPWVIILKLRTYEGHVLPALIIWRDQIDAISFRQLTILLKW